MNFGKIFYIVIQIIAFIPLLLPEYTIADNDEGLWPDISEFISSRNYKGAIDKLNDYLKSADQPEHKALIYYQIGSIYYEYIHDYNQAILSFQKVLYIKQSVENPSEELQGYTAVSQTLIADSYRRLGNYDKAIDEYRNIAKQYSGTRYSKTAESNIRGILNALKEIEFYNRIIANQPSSDISARIQFEIAELFSPQNLNNPEQAIKEYMKVVEKYPDNPKSVEAQLKIADIYRYVLHSPEDAISAYQQILDRHYVTDKMSAEAMFQIGMIYYNDLRQYSKASEIFTRFLREYPIYWKFPAGVYWQAMCYEQLKDYDSAIESFELFIQIYPEGESRLLADIGRLGEKDLEGIISKKIEELKKLAPKAKWERAEIFNASGNYRSALNIYREIMAKYPDSEYAKDAYIKAKNMEILTELQMCQEIAKSKSQDAPQAQYKTGEIYETVLQDYPRALKEYETVVTEYPNTYWSAEALYRMGSIYSGNIPSRSKSDRNIRKTVKLDYTKAIEKYTQLTRQYPNMYRSAEAHYQMGEIYRVYLKDYTKALDEYDKVIKNYPKITYQEREGFKDSLADQALFKIGKVYYENVKDRVKALDIFSRFVNDSPDSCRKAAVYSYISAIQEEQKDYDSAINTIEKIIDMIVEGNVQSLYFVRDSAYGIKIADGEITSLEVQREIIKRLRQKIMQLQQKIAQLPPEYKRDSNQ
ncbi:TPA: tetratricopeptide repeat protein [Candidatus Poribacteria bacterium]|nr:tetratricopeptide repeat protein [Candidatus Poribacteria bacterium]